MEKIKVIELFSGIGSQTQALKNIKIPHEVVNTCEWSINSIISYGEIHNDTNKFDKSRQEMINYLQRFTFSMDTKVPYELKNIKNDKLKLLYKNHINSRNLGSIVDVKGSELVCDLLTYSFPCQDLSLQGRQRGLYDGKTSSLLWEVGRLLSEMKIHPEILIMENVSSILSKKHKKGFEIWKDFLKNMGYHNYVLVLKSSNFDIPQNRERCFMISSLREIKNIEEIKGTRTEKTIKNILEHPDEKYFLPNLEKFLPEKIVFNNTKNGIRSIDLVGYTSFTSENKVYSIDSISPTLTATGANSKIKILDNGKLRKLSPLESWKLMGFTKKEFDKVSHIHTDSELVKQAGNSIVVNVLEKIFEKIYKC